MLVCIPASATPAGFGSVAGPSDLNAIRTRRAQGPYARLNAEDPEDDRLWTAVFRLAVGQNSSADGSPERLVTSLAITTSSLTGPSPCHPTGRAQPSMRPIATG